MSEMLWLYDGYELSPIIDKNNTNEAGKCISFGDRGTWKSWQICGALKIFTCNLYDAKFDDSDEESWTIGYLIIRIDDLCRLLWLMRHANPDEASFLNIKI